MTEAEIEKREKIERVAYGVDTFNYKVLEEVIGALTTSGHATAKGMHTVLICQKRPR